MAETEMKFELAADTDAILAFLSVPECVGKVIPFVDHTDEKGHWVLKDQQSKVTQTKKLVPTLTVESGGIIEWVGKGEKLMATLRLELAKKGTGTEIKSVLRMDIEGALGIVLAPIISLNIRNQLEGIALGLREEFENPSAPGAPCHACPICGRA